MIGVVPEGEANFWQAIRQVHAAVASNSQVSVVKEQCLVLSLTIDVKIIAFANALIWKAQDPLGKSRSVVISIYLSAKCSPRSKVGFSRSYLVYLSQTRILYKGLINFRVS